MLANRTVRWSLGTAALCLVLIAAAWFLLISPRRDDATALRDQAAASDDQAAALQVTLAQLKSQATGLPQQKEKLKKIAAELAPDADIPNYLNVLQDTSTQAGVDLTSISPGTPTLVTLAGAGAGAAAATNGLGSAGDLVSIPMTLAVSGDYTQLTAWLQQLQTKVSRSYLVNSFTLAASSESSGSTGELSGASIDESGSLEAAATSTPTSTSKGQEGATATATATGAAATGTATPAATAPATATATGGTTGETSTADTTWTLTLNGMVFVLLTDDSTLEDVKADAAAAQASLGGTWTEVTPSATATPTTGGTTTTTSSSDTAGTS